MFANRTPAQLYAFVFGVVLVAAGVIGFFYNASFEVGSDTPRDAVLGLLDVNGWHNVVHIATGALGLATAASAPAARVYALSLGVVYLLVFVLGVIVGDGGVIVGLVPVNTEDNVLHLLIGLIGIGAGLAPGSRARAAQARA